MKQIIYRQLEELEREAAAERRAAECSAGPSRAELLSEMLDKLAVTQLPGESVAETTARAAGISVREVKDVLWERAQWLAH